MLTVIQYCLHQGLLHLNAAPHWHAWRCCWDGLHSAICVAHLQWLTMAQGPIARVRLRELSIGRSASAKKAAAGVAEAVTSFRPRIPLNCRGVELQLRVPPPPLPAQKQKHDSRSQRDPPARRQPAAAADAAQLQVGADGSAQQGAAAQPGAQRSAAQQGKVAGAAALRWLVAATRWVAARLPPLPVGLPLRLAGSMALQLLLALVPSMPVRVKDIEVRFEVGCFVILVSIWLSCTSVLDPGWIQNLTLWQFNT